jgi:hypothetical protein
VRLLSALVLGAFLCGSLPLAHAETEQERHERKIKEEKRKIKADKRKIKSEKRKIREEKRKAKAAS